MEPLINILRRALNHGLEVGWLYLPAEVKRQSETLGIILDADKMKNEDLDSEGRPLIAAQNKLVETLDNQTIEGIVHAATVIEAVPSDELLLEAFEYYCEHDAFLPERGYEPPPIEETILRLDRDFYDSLGEESDHEKCRREGCDRGRTKWGIFCRVHHFEMIKQKPCPF